MPQGRDSAKISFFTACKPSILLLSLIIWNLFCGIGIYYNGGLGRIEHPLSKLMMVFAGSFAALIGFGPIVSDRIRKIMLLPGIRFENVKKPDFLLIGGLGGFVCVISLIGFTSDAVSGKIDRQVMNISDKEIVSIKRKVIPPIVSEFSSNGIWENDTLILLSTSFENPDMTNTENLRPFINTGKEKWKVASFHSNSGQRSVNMIPNGNPMFTPLAVVNSIFGREPNAALLNSSFSDQFKPFDVSVCSSVEMEFYRYSVSNPKKRTDFNCGSFLKIYFRTDGGKWIHKKSFCGEHKTETSGWQKSQLRFDIKGSSAIEFKFVYGMAAPKRDPDVFYLIDDLKITGIKS